MFIDNLDDYPEPDQPFDSIESSGLRAVTDRLFTFITRKPIGKPKESIFHPTKMDREKLVIHCHT